MAGRVFIGFFIGLFVFDAIWVSSMSLAIRSMKGIERLWAKLSNYGIGEQGQNERGLATDQLHSSDSGSTVRMCLDCKFTPCLEFGVWILGIIHISHVPEYVRQCWKLFGHIPILGSYDSPQSAQITLYSQNNILFTNRDILKWTNNTQFSEISKK